MPRQTRLPDTGRSQARDHRDLGSTSAQAHQAQRAGLRARRVPVHSLQQVAPRMNKRLELRPISLRAANDYVAQEHRHNGRTSRNGGKFAISCWLIDPLLDEASLAGVAIVGNPLSATYMDGLTAEVLRVCVAAEGGERNACSMLYGACWRAWKAMGGKRLITYTLQKENGASLRAAGWRIDGKTKPVAPGWRKNDHLVREHQPVMLEPKYRWIAG